MSIEDAVRDSLAARAEAVDPTPLSGPHLRTRAGVRRRRAVRSWLVAVGAAAAVLATVLVVPDVLRRDALPPASGSVTRWAPRGDLAADVGLVREARRAWEGAPVLPGERPHHTVQVLVAAETPFGRYVMLTAVNALGHRRLAVFSDDPRDHPAYARRLRLRSDRAFPEDRSLLTYAELRDDGTLLLVAGPPSATRLRWEADGDDWRDLPADRGAAAAVVPVTRHEIGLRAYEGNRRVAAATAEVPVAAMPYEPDPALLTGERAMRGCDGGRCGTGTLAQVDVPGEPGSLSGVRRPAERSWEDMADQAEQLAHNWLQADRPVTSWRSAGIRISGLLPGDTGVHLSQVGVNDLPDHLVLYVDRPEWANGRLYVVMRYDPADPPRAVTALVPGAGGSLWFVAFAGADVGVRYRVRDGVWHDVPVRDGIAVDRLREPGFTGEDVEVAVTYGGRTTEEALDGPFDVERVAAEFG